MQALTRKFLSITICLVVFCHITGCATTPEEVNPKQWIGQVITTADLNPNDYNRPSPLVIIFYQLADDNTFLNADFFTLYNSDKNLLGTDLLSKKELELLPNQHIELKWTLNNQTKYIGIVAAYNHLAQSEWRVIFPTDEKELSNNQNFWNALFSQNEQELEIYFTNNKIQIGK